MIVARDWENKQLKGPLSPGRGSDAQSQLLSAIAGINVSGRGYFLLCVTNNRTESLQPVFYFNIKITCGKTKKKKNPVVLPCGFRPPWISSAAPVMLRSMSLAYAQNVRYRAPRVPRPCAPNTIAMICWSSFRRFCGFALSSP